jgi:hypothetical protein
MKYLLLISLLIFPSVAKADYFVWQDAKTGLSLSYPDTWKKQSTNGVHEIFQIEAPSDGDNPVCKVSASKDKRFVIFPPDYGDAVQRTAVSVPFWKSYMALDYDDYVIDKVYDGGGFGRWHASYATLAYNVREGTQMQSRRGIAFASLYYDNMYIVECSALAQGYEKWEKDFRSIIKSIDFKKIYNERAIGEYADFLSGSEMYFWAQTGPEGTTEY